MSTFPYTVIATEELNRLLNTLRRKPVVGIQTIEDLVRYAIEYHQRFEQQSQTTLRVQSAPPIDSIAGFFRVDIGWTHHSSRPVSLTGQLCRVMLNTTEFEYVDQLATAYGIHREEVITKIISVLRAVVNANVHRHRLVLRRDASHGLYLHVRNNVQWENVPVLARCADTHAPQ